MGYLDFRYSLFSIATHAPGPIPPQFDRGNGCTCHSLFRLFLRVEEFSGVSRNDELFSGSALALPVTTGLLLWSLARTALCLVLSIVAHVRTREGEGRRCFGGARIQTIR